MVRADFPPEIGLLSDDEVRLIDACLPSLALEDDTMLLDALQAILHSRCSAEDWAYYESLPIEQRQAVLDGVRAQIPLIGPDAV